MAKRGAIDPDQKKYLRQTYDFVGDLLWVAADSARNIGEFNLSFEYQGKSIEMEPHNHYRRFVYASNLGKDGRIDDAIEVLNDGLRKYPHELAFENCKALVYGDAEIYEKAFEVLDNVLRIRPNDVDAIINYGVIFEKKGEYESSEEYFQKALAIDPTHEVAIANLKNLHDNIDSKPQKISLCMIVKDEEHFLPGCLKSVQGLIDELIVVDTGSTDRTMEIAREYGAKIYQHPWQNDFSFHRNQSMSYATGDWILILDADEELDPSEHEMIRSSIKRKNIYAISFVVYNKIQHGRTGFLNSHRMFRNGRGYHYSGIVHNQLIMDDTYFSSQFKVYHHGYGLSDEQMNAKGRRTEALLKKQLEENPDNAFAHFNLAQIYRGLGDPESSLRHSTRVTELLSPESKDRLHVYIMALDQMGCAYVGLKQIDKAKETFYKALELKPDYLDPLFNLGYVYAQGGEFDKSDEVFNRYLNVRKSFSAHHEWMGLILNNLNSQFAAYYGLGLSQMHRNNIDKAIENFNTVVELVGDFEFTHHLLARCYRQKKDHTKIIIHCEKAIEHGHEDAEIYIIKGEAYLNLGESTKATECFDKAKELDTSNFASHLGLASAASLDGKYDEALKLVDDALRVSPNSPQALAARGDLLYREGNFDNAAESYKNQSLASPQDPGSWNNLGNCFIKQNNFASAEECYRMTLKIAPNFGIGYRNLAVTMIKRNKIDEAISYFEKYLTFNSGDFEAQVTLADLFYNRKEYWKSIPYYENFIRRNPSQIDALLRLSDCYFNLGKLDAAVMGYNAVLKVNSENQVATTRLADINGYKSPVTSR